MKIKIRRASRPGKANKDTKPCPSAVWDRGAWYITLERVEDLFALVEEVGDLVLSQEPGIVIYDDYME